MITKSIFSFKQKIISFLVAITLLFSLFSSSALVFANFSDVNETTKYYQAIEFLKNNDVVGGYPDGTFKPEQTLNRAELLKILIEATVEDEIDESKYKNCFPDVKGEWFAKYVCYGKEKGIVNGYPDGTFKPAQYVKKVEAAKMALEAFEFPIPEEKITESLYSDTDSSQWYAKYLKVLKNKNILDEGNVYSPANDISRGQISNYMYRSMAYSFEDFEFLKGVYSKNKYFVFYKNNLLSEADIDTFEAIDESYAKDKKHVYHAGGLIYGADSSTFELFGENSSYAKDGENVYYIGTKIENADADSFGFIDDSDIFAKDKNSFYYNGVIRSSVDANTVKLMHNMSFKDKNAAYYVFSQRVKTFSDIDDPSKFSPIDTSKTNPADFSGYFAYDGSVYGIEEADLETFEDLGYGYAKDKNNLYYQGKIFEETSSNINIESLEALSAYYLKDQNGVYFNEFAGYNYPELWDFEVLTSIDSNSFTMLDYNFAKDENAVYYFNSKVEGAKPSSFEIINKNYAKDNEDIFYGEIVTDESIADEEIYPPQFSIFIYKLEKIDANSFSFTNEENIINLLICGHSKDKTNFYQYGEKIVTETDISTFTDSGICFAKDKNNFFTLSQEIITMPIKFN